MQVQDRQIQDRQAEDRLDASIGAIVADPLLHARWLNTFSFLEYVGFRKIVKSQRAEALNAAILTHALEEGRHALGLKKLAVKLGGPQFDSYAPKALLCGEEAEAYFQDLDGACEEAFLDRSEAERAALVYCYVTWLVERRALQVYGAYKTALGDSEVARKLDGLLAEEAKHLTDVEASLHAGDPDFVTRSREFEAVETGLYSKFLEALAHELAAPAAA
ncbi:ferritin-like domain-containing protein [Methylocapsa aurea]|uniref:ferritin-like domain-containing protein n=1 Tax=Methylocapsa aurea TaxID=663610 RepID=UPI00068FEE90|nr:ferritin-like domain-containing protein [Methylocapsa aurea]